MVLLCGCSMLSSAEPMTQEEIYAITSESEKFTEDIINGDFTAVYSVSSDLIKETYTQDELQAVWQETIANAGEFLAVEKIEKSQVEEFAVSVSYIVYENTGVLLSLTFNTQSVLEGIFFNYYEAETTSVSELPKGLVESEFTVKTGDFELPAVLTSSQDTKSDSVLLLVHGSGPNDMNETVLALTPFKDIAWGVALQGVDTFRYDKRTFVYRENIAEKGNEYITVNEEVVDDALSAARMLKDMGYKNVYLLGHSLGGMLGPRIIEEEPELFAGFISLAGSPRSISEIQLDQNNAVISILNDDEKEETEKIVAAEKDKLAQLPSMDENELLSETIFGISAYYLRDMSNYDSAEIAKSLEIPMLFLQGSDDFQVYADVDFALWQSELDDKANVEFKLYDGLTHMFTKNVELPTNTVNDYALSASVDEEVIKDIAKFILEN